MADDNDSMDEALAGLPAEIQDTLRRALVTARARKEQGQEAAQGGASAPAVPTRGVQLPLWPDAVRAVPNGLLRSALFGAIAKGKRRYIDGEDLAAVDGVTIRYKGERLDQGDLDVWESVLHAVRQQRLGSRCRVTSYGLLQIMGKTDSGKNRKTLHRRIERLVANAVTIRQGRYTYIGGLIRSAAKDEVTQEWVIELDENLAPLFAVDQFTQVEWSIRHALDGQPLAQWLHGFYSSHAKPFPIKVETLRRLSGSENKSLFSFRQELREALDALAKATGWTWEIDAVSDLVDVHKTPTGAQARHLIRRGIKKGLKGPKK